MVNIAVLHAYGRKLVAASALGLSLAPGIAAAQCAGDTVTLVNALAKGSTVTMTHAERFVGPPSRREIQVPVAFEALLVVQETSGAEWRGGSLRAHVQSLADTIAGKIRKQYEDQGIRLDVSVGITDRSPAELLRMGYTAGPAESGRSPDGRAVSITTYHRIRMGKQVVEGPGPGGLIELQAQVQARVCLDEQAGLLRFEPRTRKRSRVVPDPGAQMSDDVIRIKQAAFDRTAEEATGDLEKSFRSLRHPLTAEQQRAARSRNPDAAFTVAVPFTFMDARYSMTVEIEPLRTPRADSSSIGP